MNVSTLSKALQVTYPELSLKNIIEYTNPKMVSIYLHKTIYIGRYAIKLDRNRNIVFIDTAIFIHPKYNSKIIFEHLQFILMLEKL